jgi:hypothetical protein
MATSTGHVNLASLSLPTCGYGFDILGKHAWGSVSRCGFFLLSLNFEFVNYVRSFEKNRSDTLYLVVLVPDGFIHSVLYYLMSKFFTEFF